MIRLLDALQVAVSLALFVALAAYVAWQWTGAL